MVLDLLLIALGITLDPLPLMAFVLVVASVRGVWKGLAFILGWLACFVGVHFAPDPFEQNLLEPPAGPSGAHWFGTDALSRDSLARVLHGGQISLKVALGVALLSTLIGVVIGALAGFYRGWLDGLLMRFTDLWIALPALPFLAVAVSIGVTVLV